MSCNFEFHPLPDNRRNFRLLELLPGLEPDPLRGRLRTEEISSAPAFEAVSYVWRVFHDDRDDATIHCQCGDGQEHAIEITWNLQTALLSIRDEHKARLVWADAVCINQRDLEERRQQVQCMRELFERAARVLVWLGPDARTFDAPDLFAFLGRTADLCPAPRQYGQRDDFHFQDLDEFLARADPRCWEMLRALHLCAVFRRIWCVQELSLAADGRLLAGSRRDEQLSLFKFKTAMFWIRKRRPLEVRRFHIPWENLDPFLYLRFVAGDVSRPPASITGSSGDQPVYFVLRSTRKCLSTNPRDMIYGLLGHSSLEKWTRDVPGLTRVPVDYKASHTELYFAVACRLVEGPQPLFTLSLVEHDESTWEQADLGGCPSWVPRWDLKRGNYILADEYRDRYEKTRSRQASIAIHDRSFQARGCVVDKVVWRSENMTLERIRAGLPGFPGQASTNIVRQNWEYLRDTALRSGSGADEVDEEDLLREFCLTLNAGCRILSKQTYKDDVTIEHRVADCIAMLSELGVSTRTRDEFKARHRNGDWDRFLATTQDLCRDRCFFRTACGLLGLGPRVSAVDDEVCIFFGAQVPFLLHPVDPSEGRYQLCGESYVHGIMNGEALAALDEDTFEEKVFDLI